VLLRRLFSYTAHKAPRNRIQLALLLLVCLARPYAVAATTSSWTGSFASDDDKRVVYLTLSAAGTLLARTWSYAGGINGVGATAPEGGFDPTLSLFDSAGSLIAYNQDGGCASVAADSITASCWDSYLSIPLPAGSYTLVLTQSENLPNGPTLADSFVYDGQPNFTAVPGASGAGFLDFFLSQRTAYYAFDIAGAGALATTITSSAALPCGTAQQAYTFTFTAQSGPGVSLVWSVLSGSLPTGLTLNPATGILSGTPATAVQTSFAIQVTDGIEPVIQNVTLTIAAAEEEEEEVVEVEAAEAEVAALLRVVPGL
jgi:hypothetical protein